MKDVEDDMENVETVVDEEDVEDVEDVEAVVDEEDVEDVNVEDDEAENGGHSFLLSQGRSHIYTYKKKFLRDCLTRWIWLLKTCMVSSRT